MRGTELIMRMKTELQRSAKRAGREVSQENMDRLTAIHQKLAAGHDTMEEAMRELAAFVVEKASDDGTNDPPESSDGYVDNLPAAEAGVDTKDARSRSRSMGARRGDPRRHTAQRSARRLSTRVDLYHVGNAPVRRGGRSHRPR
jgi:hypothetical protein